MKPATPLLTHNAAKSSISCEQRCQRFQPSHTLHQIGKQCTRQHTIAETSPLPRNFARNSIGKSINKVLKRCNSNDLNSMFERVVGELRAKLGAVSAAMCAGAGHEACGVKAEPGRAPRRRAERSSRRGDSRAGHHPPAHTATRHHWCEGRRRVRRARAGFETTRRDTHQHASRGRCGGHRRDRRAWLRCPWAAAGPGQATHRHPDRLEAAAWPAGPGRASRQRAERSSRRGRRAGGQAARRPEICRGNKQQLAARTASGRAATHRHTQRPGPPAPTTPAAPQATRHRGAGPQARAPSATTQTRTLRSTCVRSRSARAARRWRRSSRSPRLRRRAGPRR